MASICKRLREPITLFDVLCEVAAPTDSVHDAPWILWLYPDDFRDNSMLKSVATFAFPCPRAMKEQSLNAIQLFSFMLTDGEGLYTFGYCRYTPLSNTCLCILSSLPYTNLFFRLLNHFGSVMNEGTPDELEKILIRAYHQEIPNPGEIYSIESSLGKNKLEVICPDPKMLPTIQNNRNLMEYFNSMKEEDMIRIYCSMLHERRIIFTSRFLSRLSACVLAAGYMIFPMHWQHVYIPVLPESLFDYLHMPMPFLVGVPHCALSRVNAEIDLTEVVLFDLDAGSLRSQYTEVDRLPKDVYIALKEQLSSSNTLGDGLARAFLRSTVLLIGGYRDGLLKQEDSQIQFSFDKFLSMQKHSMQNFLSGFRHVQIFHQFIEERVKILNERMAPNDEFENECHICEYKKIGATDFVFVKGGDYIRNLPSGIKNMGKRIQSSAKNLAELRKNGENNPITGSYADETKSTFHVPNPDQDQASQEVAPLMRRLNFAEEMRKRHGFGSLNQLNLIGTPTNPDGVPNPKVSAISNSTSMPSCKSDVSLASRNSQPISQGRLHQHSGARFW